MCKAIDREMTITDIRLERKNRADDQASGREKS